MSEHKSESEVASTLPNPRHFFEILDDIVRRRNRPESVL